MPSGRSSSPAHTASYTATDGTRTPAHPGETVGHGRCADVPVRIGLRARFIAGENARAPGRHSWPWAVRGRPRPHWASCKASLRTRTSARPGDAVGLWAVRGRPRPHWGLVQGFIADEDVRAPMRNGRPWAVRGRPRTACGSRPHSLVQRFIYERGPQPQPPRLAPRRPLRPCRPTRATCCTWRTWSAPKDRCRPRSRATRPSGRGRGGR